MSTPARATRAPSPAATPASAPARARAPQTSRPAAARPWTLSGAPLVARSVLLRAASGAQPAAAPLRVSSPDDAAEREAESVAERIMQAPDRGASPTPRVTRAATGVQRAADATSTGASIAGELQAELGGGAPLAPTTRAFMEPRFGAVFGDVRVHTGERAARLALALGARAFTYGRHVFFGRGAYEPDTQSGRRLLAHELVHVVQQGEARARDDAGISQRVPVSVQRLGVRDALDYFADAANNIPGYAMLTFVIGVNPINMSRVERNATNLFRAIIGFMPGGEQVFQALQNHGILDRVGQWAMQQLNALGASAGSLRAALDRFLDSLGWRDIFRLGSLWDRAKSIFTTPIHQMIGAVGRMVGDILRFIREAILRPVARLAEGTRGYDLLKAVLGEDPVTGEAVPRNAETLIGGFMRLIGQEEVWQNIQRGNAIARAWAWFQTALEGLLGFVREIPRAFIAAFQALEVVDLVLVPRAFAKVAGAFGSFVGRFLSWAGGTVLDLLEILFSVVAPGVMTYVRRAAGAVQTILRNPMAFVRNLMRAGLQGLRQFMNNFLTHLRASLIGWLTGAMSGANIYIPQGFALREILKFGLSVLGLTWQNIRAKLVRATNETAVRAMEGAFDIVVVLVREGPAAAWQRILESLTNLREMVIEQVMRFVSERIVTAALTRLLSMLDPSGIGAVIQAIIAIYNTVMFFVERMRQIAQVAASFIDSISAIASGAVGAAANRVERTLAGLLTLVISFLARLAGLGRVSDAVTRVIDRIRQPIDRALDRVVEWVVAQARRLGRFVAQAGVPQDPRERLRLGMDAGLAAVRGRRAGTRLSAAVVSMLVAAVRIRYGFSSLEAVERSGQWWLRGVVNPPDERPIQDDDLELARMIRQVADEEFSTYRGRTAATGSGTHEDPYRLTGSEGIAPLAHHLGGLNLGQGRIAVYDVTQGGPSEERGVVQRPGFTRGGDLRAYGATDSARRIPIGSYPDITRTMQAIARDQGVSERVIARDLQDLLRGGEASLALRSRPGVAGGMLATVATEVMRDPVALVTLGASLSNIVEGSQTFSTTFTPPSSPPVGTTGGIFSHSSRPALAPLRGVRQRLGIPLPSTAPASRGTAAEIRSIIERDLITVISAAQTRLRSRNRPPLSEVRDVVREAIRDLAGR